MNKNFRFYVSGIATAIITRTWDEKENRPSLTPEEVSELTLEYATQLADTVDAHTTEEVVAD